MAKTTFTVEVVSDIPATAKILEAVHEFLVDKIEGAEDSPVLAVKTASGDIVEYDIESRVVDVEVEDGEEEEEE